VLVRALLVLLLGLALAACGSGSDEAKVAYGAKVSHLCLLAADQIRELHMDDSVSVWEGFGAQAVRIQEHFDTALTKLRAPDEIASEAAAYLKVNEKVLADDKAALAASWVPDWPTLEKAWKRANRDSRASWPLAKAIDATGCYIS
jgi:hypothetical protein